tara:strand:- start:395 stop:793 length:399 start_codon:yes stop_codon:yes gene_type:complete
MTFEEIRTVVEDQLGLNLKEKSRKKEYVEARYIYFKLCMDYADKKTLSAIGNSLHKDHATVLHGLRSVNDWMLYDITLLHQYEDLHKFLMKMSKAKKEKHSLYFSLAKKMHKITASVKKLEKKIREYESQSK